jgi:hypothetical protein
MFGICRPVEAQGYYRRRRDDELPLYRIPDLLEDPAHVGGLYAQEDDLPLTGRVDVVRGHLCSQLLQGLEALNAPTGGYDPADVLALLQALDYGSADDSCADYGYFPDHASHRIDSRLSAGPFLKLHMDAVRGRGGTSSGSGCPASFFIHAQRRIRYARF